MPPPAATGTTARDRGRWMPARPPPRRSRLAAEEEERSRGGVDRRLAHDLVVAAERGPEPVERVVGKDVPTARQQPLDLAVVLWHPLHDGHGRHRCEQRAHALERNVPGDGQMVY